MYFAILVRSIPTGTSVLHSVIFITDESHAIKMKNFGTFVSSVREWVCEN